MRFKLTLVLAIIMFVATFSFAQHRYSGSRHTTSHGGHYSGGHGSSHKGGHYKNVRTSNHYGRHKR
jgi:hypothetical protein